MTTNVHPHWRRFSLAAPLRRAMSTQQISCQHENRAKLACFRGNGMRYPRMMHCNSARITRMVPDGAPCRTRRRLAPSARKQRRRQQWQSPGKPLFAARTTNRVACRMDAEKPAQPQGRQGSTPGWPRESIGRSSAFFSGLATVHARRIFHAAAAARIGVPRRGGAAAMGRAGRARHGTESAQDAAGMEGRRDACPAPSSPLTSWLEGRPWRLMRHQCLSGAVEAQAPGIGKRRGDERA